MGKELNDIRNMLSASTDTEKSKLSASYYQLSDGCKKLLERLEFINNEIKRHDIIVEKTFRDRDCSYQDPW